MRRWLWLLGVALLGACASLPEGVRPGMERAEVLQRLGLPGARYLLEGGERLQYSRQPAGRQVYNIDLDAQGRVRRVTQALDPAVLATIEPGVWTRAQVLQTLGKPAEVGRVARFDGDIWTWRYLEPISSLRLFHVYFDADGTVVRTQSTDESLNDNDRLGLRRQHSTAGGMAMGPGFGRSGPGAWAQGGW